jgi:hypothetical protein
MGALCHIMSWYVYRSTNAFSLRERDLDQPDPITIIAEGEPMISNQRHQDI